MAYIRRLPSGKFQATVRHPAGHKITRTDPLKRAVKAWAEETEAAFRNGPTATEHGRRTTVDTWWGRWQAARRVESATTVKNLSHWRNHIQPRWGSWPLETVGRSRLEVQRWVTDMTRAGVGAPTVHAVYNLFAGLLHDAELERLIPVSPCRDIDLPVIVPPEDRWLTDAEYRRIQDALAMRSIGRRGGHRAPDPQARVWQAYVALGCFSGLRPPGELAGLDVGHVDFARGLVHVTQVVTRKEGLRPYPKTSGSRRWVPFPPEVAALLWPLCADRSAGPVFTAARGGRVGEQHFRERVWRPALGQAGVDYVDPYTMRHTCASWLRQAGVPDPDIAQILGHTSTRMLGVYAHQDPTRHDRVRAAWAGGAPVAHDQQQKTPSPSGLGV